jgi:glycosyltransferase involved in cell wall biosynthesis
MACATPVVAFANSAQIEVIADGGLLVPDGDIAAMAAAMRPLLDDVSVWQHWSDCARERAAMFDWNKAIDAHVEILTSVALG